MNKANNQDTIGDNDKGEYKMTGNIGEGTDKNGQDDVGFLSLVNKPYTNITSPPPSFPAPSPEEFRPPAVDLTSAIITPIYTTPHPPHHCHPHHAMPPRQHHQHHHLHRAPPSSPISTTPPTAAAAAATTLLHLLFVVTITTPPSRHHRDHLHPDTTITLATLSHRVSHHSKGAFD
ncbi:hypothetical protein Tco_1066015 [Tanacetum coccineum]